MTSEAELAASYRDRAKQLHRIADLDADRETASTLRKIAAQYDTLAGSLAILDAQTRNRLKA